MLNTKLLEPFKKLCELIPDMNIKRARNKGQWIFTDEPLDWTEKFPRITLEISNQEIKERPNQQSIQDDTYSYATTYDVKITYYSKRMDEYECHDGVIRKGKLFAEFMMTNIILPTITRNKIAICKKYPWMETINVINVDKVDDIEKYGLEQSVTIRAQSTINDKVPISNDGYIKTINLNETI
jgi:hypothetical protein